MCGICGILNPSGVYAEEIDQMLSTIRHRGPDDEGKYINGMVGLGNRRLSIIDISGGQQPLANEDHTIWVVYNGEIYNYQPLMKELEAKGHVFRTHSDTEVIVHLYEEYGELCVEKLNGMFAFALWDQRKRQLVMARDRIGQKPLYYTQTGSRFIFASEIKAILALVPDHRTINYDALHEYLSLRFISPPNTIFKNISKLPSANILVYKDQQISLKRYWHLSFIQKHQLDETDLLEGLQHKLSTTIHSHTVSDVPIGAFLSGGLDSSMVVAILGKDYNIRPQTFTIGVEESDFNELPYAAMVAKEYQTEHHEEYVAPDLITLLPKMIWHMDEPSDPIAACMYHSAQLASRHVKVVLGGDGGDELFAGFDRYLGKRYLQIYKWIPEFLRLKVTGPILDLIPDSFTYKSMTQKMRWVHQLSLMPNPGREYAEATCFFRFSHQDKQGLYTPELWKQFSEIDAADAIVHFYNQGQAEDPVDRMLYTDFMTRLPEHSLMLTDRMTMAHSLEARSPFLDHELVEYLATFPSKLKINGGLTKYILRKLAMRYLPKTIVHRQKQGFMLPIAYWFRKELYPCLRETILESHAVKQGIFQYPYIVKLLEEHKHNKKDHHVRLWMLLNLEIWHQIFVEQKNYQDVQENLRAFI